MTLAFPKTVIMPPKANLKDASYRAIILAQPCIICRVEGMEQKSRTTGHHCICGRYSQAKRADAFLLPLCDCHHQGLRFDRDRTKIAIHLQQSKWEATYGPDYEWLPQVQDLIESGEFTAWSA